MRSFTCALGLLVTLLPGSLSQSLASSASTAAPTASGNPAGAQYIASLPVSQPVNGAVVVSSTPDGLGVSIQATINNLPVSGGPFLYQIQANPVASNGNCSTVGGTLNPYGASDKVACDTKNPQNCQVGDLSGKHGTVPGPTFSANYVDKFISTITGSPAFVSNRSIVVLYNNNTIITCANFTQNGGSSPVSSAYGAGVSVVSVASSTAIPVVGGAPGSAPLVSTVTVSGAAQTVTVGAPAAPSSTSSAATQVWGASAVTVTAAGPTVTVTSVQATTGV